MNPSGKPWEERLQQAGERLETDLRSAIRYLDEEVVPELRRTGSSALRKGSEELRRLAAKLDDERIRREGGDS